MLLFFFFSLNISVYFLFFLPSALAHSFSLTLFNRNSYWFHFMFCVIKRFDVILLCTVLLCQRAASSRLKCAIHPLCFRWFCFFFAPLFPSLHYQIVGKEIAKFALNASSYHRHNVRGVNDCKFEMYTV